MIVLGIDTSCYTTSVAAADEAGVICSHRKLLPVQQGARGLRQSEAVFAHIKQLPDLYDQAMESLAGRPVDAVCVSASPRDDEASYMPVFLSGLSFARVAAASLKVPLLTTTHQRGHVRAALQDSGLRASDYLALHLSGGTTELLLTTPETGSFRCEKIGGTTDISAGQLIDRTGQLLSMPFPAGKALDAASEQTQTRDLFRVKVTDFSFSFSGVQNKVQDYYRKTEDANAAAYYALASVVEAVRTATKNARKRYPGYPVLFSGGVASNSMLRRRLADLAAVFGEPRYSTDNAMGIAVLTYRAEAGV